MTDPKPFSTCQSLKPGQLDKLNLADYIMEPKIDGWRIQMRVTPTGTTTWTRTGHDATGKLFLPETELVGIADSVGTEFWLDGEAVYVDENGEPDFNFTARVLGSGLDVAIMKQDEGKKYLSYYVFDLLSFDGHDIRQLPLDERTSTLFDFMSPYAPSHVRPVLATAVEDSYHANNIEQFKEGSVLKLRDAPYMGKRSKAWLKWKVNPDEDVVVMGFVEGKGKYEGTLGAIEFGQYVPPCTLQARGFCAGMTDDMRNRIWQNKYTYLHKVMRIQHFGVLANGGFRHPQFKGMRSDKRPEECVWS
jgi:bifunctional non-homologous end joining protein LigD